MISGALIRACPDLCYAFGAICDMHNQAHNQAHDTTWFGHGDWETLPRLKQSRAIVQFDLQFFVPFVFAIHNISAPLCLSFTMRRLSR